MSRLKLAAIAAGILANRQRGDRSRRSALDVNLGPAAQSSAKTYAGYYDGHKDTYIVTDVSSKSQASSMHINYSPPLANVKARRRSTLSRARLHAARSPSSAPSRVRAVTTRSGRADRDLEGRRQARAARPGRPDRRLAKKASSPSRTRMSS